ncbi:MAG TPA: phosphoadenosine phosphosulfate reductase family protein [Bacteroidales bacterium]|mgnify:CR=1 FL=1|nr:phosphoadenosine phosphosulfate reductase family protein [Bacteroidales bacterium]
MYSYTWDAETGGLLLNSSPLSFSKEPRPVYYKELDILGFDRYWDYAKNDAYPYMWAEANNYYYRGRYVAKTKGGSLYTAPEIVILEEAEPDGIPLRFVDIPAMVEKNRDLLEKLAADTIKKIYNTYVEYMDRVDVFYVAFSGGKDSIVVLDLVQRALPHNKFKVLFGDTGMEFPDTYKIVDQTKLCCEEAGIEFLRSESDFAPEFTWRHFGPPAQTMRWCCSVHKTAPQILLLREYTENPNFRGMAFTGIRGDESASRSEYEGISHGKKVQGQYSCHPILEWNSAELFAYIYDRGLLINDAYKKGNSRAGCLVCPLAASKNMYFKEQAYNSNCEGYRTTTTFNDIILETSSKELSNPSAVKEFMDIGGWKARRSGKELSFAKRYTMESFDKGVLTIQVTRLSTDWRQWIKTIGEITFLENGDIEVLYGKKIYHIEITENNEGLVATIVIGSNSQQDIYFMSELKTIFRKSAYCVGCRVCEANCPNGFISMKDGCVIIDDRCVKCKKCHDVFHGCLVANSMRLPKGEKKMGSIDRYGNMGIELDWVVEYFKMKDEFWISPHSLGTNMVKNLKSFLNDAEVTVKTKFSDFGRVVDCVGIENADAWALMLCNLAYTSEFNWWIKNIEFSVSHTPDSIYAMLDDSMSKNSRSHIVSAYKNILISIPQFGTEIGLGSCNYDLKNGKRFWNSVVRLPWQNPNPLVILYSLYKFAEACGDYHQFTLSRLLTHEIDSDGISPTEIFGLGRDQMEKILNGLSINYPDFINASFTLDLDNITLNSEKTSQDVLSLL